MEKRKFNWVQSEMVCRVKEEGEFGLKVIKMFNLGLLEKCKWIYINEKDRLRFKILECKYMGITIGVIRVDKFSFLWWRDVSLLDKEDGCFKSQWITNSMEFLG